MVTQESISPPDKKAGGACTGSENRIILDL